MLATEPLVPAERPVSRAAQDLGVEPVQVVLELLYFDGCPNHDAFLPHLRQLLAAAAYPIDIKLVRVATAEDAYRLRFLGSPTVRIDGVDVDPSAEARTDYGLQCRLYTTPDGLRGTPDDRTVLAALNAKAGH
jgi:hypothetical protein